MRERQDLRQRRFEDDVDGEDRQPAVRAEPTGQPDARRAHRRFERGELRDGGDHALSRSRSRKWKSAASRVEASRASVS